MNIKKMRNLALGGVASLIGVYLLALVWVALGVGRDTAQVSDAIVVLGARVHLRNGINPCLLARVKHGVELWKSGYAPVLVMSGGDDIEDGANEAHHMAKMAVEWGVPKSAILEESKSSSTYENLKFTQVLLAQHNKKTAILVSDPYHMLRASLIAEQLKVDHTVSPAENSPCWTQWTVLSKGFLREPLALLENKLSGYW